LYERRIRYLEERVATGKNKYEVLEQRRAREIEVSTERPTYLSCYLLCFTIMISLAF
jgi:hypothetical protein